MPIVSCKICTKKFYTKPSWLKNGSGIYCSIKCRGLAKRKGEFILCSMCGKRVYKSLQNLKRSKSGKYFCGRACSLLWLSTQQVGNKHGNWKGGEYSYRDILNRSKMKIKCMLCDKDDKRILTIHHIDKNRRNNSLKNLAWLCYNCHFLVHHSIEVKQKFDATRNM